MAQFPTAFETQIRTLFGAESEFFLLALQNAPTTSIRYNPFKPSIHFVNEEQVPWTHHGYFLNHRPEFVFDPLFHAGAYYVQESSSMFLEHVFKFLFDKSAKPITVLDLCAAPGGKSTLLSSLMKPNDVLVSNEVIKQRVGVLEENIVKWGQPNCIVTHSDPKHLGALTHFFDYIVIDAPCSGEGLFKRDANAVEEWSEAHIELCMGRQQRIMNDVINALKPGGFLVYSTCTFNKFENEDNVKWLMNQYQLRGVDIPIKAEWNISPSLDDEVIGYRFLPHKVKGEGLFMACLQKSESNELAKQQVTKRNKPILNQADINSLKPWLVDADEFDFVSVGDYIHAIPFTVSEKVAVLGKHVYIKSAGIRMGTMAHGQLIPDHQLALSSKLSDKQMRIELGLDDAIRYLRKDTLALPQASLGWTLITYKNLPLGWAKILPNRVNNYFPSSLRIIKEYAYQT